MHANLGKFTVSIIHMHLALYTLRWKSYFLNENFTVQETTSKLRSCHESTTTPYLFGKRRNHIAETNQRLVDV